MYLKDASLPSIAFVFSPAEAKTDCVSFAMKRSSARSNCSAAEGESAASILALPQRSLHINSSLFFLSASLWVMSAASEYAPTRRWFSYWIIMSPVERHPVKRAQTRRKLNAEKVFTGNDSC